LPDSIEGFSNPDNDSRGPWKADPFQVEGERPNQRYEIKNPNTGQIYLPNSGCSWKNDYGNYQRLIKENRIIFGVGGESGPQRKRFWSEAKERGKVPKSWWDDIETTSNGTSLLNNIFNKKVFSNPKPVELVKRFLELSLYKDFKMVLDFFAGSGTTGHAVIELNREDQGNRKFILVEMGKYFNTVLKPRISKAIYSKGWKNGKPVDREGISSMFKYSSLESYEDTLNNLDLKASHSQLQLISSNPKLREEYMLSYMLDLESKESLLRIKDFTSPFDYKLKIIEENETQEKSVDLIETFNYLLGFNTETLDYDSEKGILYLEGKNNADEKILIIWRDLAKLNNEALNEWFSKRYSSKELEHAAIYVNGDNNLENLKLSEDRWKLRLIESEFHRLMFDTSAVEAL